MDILTERDLKKVIKAVLTKYSDPDTGTLWWFMPGASGYTNKAGVPDYILLANRIMVTIEAKVPPNKVEGQQARCMYNLACRGAIPLVVTPDEIEALDNFMRSYTDGDRPRDFTWLKHSAEESGLVFKRSIP